MEQGPPRSGRRPTSLCSGSTRHECEERSMFDLAGKTALVTGASGGIGSAIARAFHQQGATVALSGTRRDALDRLHGELKDRAHWLPCNLADKDEVEALGPKWEGGLGKLDTLVPK